MYENGKLTREELAQVMRRINIVFMNNVQWGVSTLYFETDAADYICGRKQFTLTPGTYLYCFMKKEQYSLFHREVDLSVYNSELRDNEHDDYVVMWRIS